MEHHNHHDHHDHDKHAGHHPGIFKQKFWLSLLLTIPAVLFSQTIQDWIGVDWAFSGSQYIPAVFGLAIFFYGGLVFLKSAKTELQSKQPGMMTLISMAITVALVYSLAVTLGLVEGMDFWWELATLVTIMLLGHWIEMAAVAKASSSLEEIAKLLPDKADKLVGGQTAEVLVSDLKVGDLVLVRPGSRVPVDGIVTDGRSSVDEAAITGESQPVSKTADDQVVAGTANQDGSLTVRVTKLGENTALAGIMRLVAEAQNSKSQTQVLADKAAFWLTIVALVAALSTFIGWLMFEDLGYALTRAVTVLIIACPHALGLAIPLVVSISTTLSARNGLLIRKRLALESARNLDWVLFDKTGTLTKGEHEVTDIWTVSDLTEKDILQMTASLEQNSEHIVGRGIVKKSIERQISLSRVEDFQALPGLGVRGKINGQELVAASQRYLQENNLDVPAAIDQATKQAAERGITEVYLIKERQVIGALGLSDTLRQESKEAVVKLRSMGIKIAMITGDSEAVAARVASELDLDQYFSEVRPEDKSAKVKQLQADGQKVAMVGDGINDAPALTQADIGIAIGAGTDVAIKSADIILTKSSPQDVAKVINLSKFTYAKMVQNLFWATGYNILALPLAAGVLAGAGLVLSPAAGAVLMSVSTLVVAINAQLLRRVKL